MENRSTTAKLLTIEVTHERLIVQSRTLKCDGRMMAITKLRFGKHDQEPGSRSRRVKRKTGNRKTDVRIREVWVCLETQRVRRDHSSVLHHRRRDGPQVLEELSGLAGAQSLNVLNDSLMGLHTPGLTQHLLMLS